MTTRVVRWTVSVIRLRAVSGRGHECNCNHSPLWFAGCRGSFADLAGCLVDRIAGMMVVGVVATLLYHHCRARRWAGRVLSGVSSLLLTTVPNFHQCRPVSPLIAPHRPTVCTTLLASISHTHAW
ncbi:hypothetical protein ECG_08240 [Echinococcus granulosus]|nr:hypothetical protein ECG_08240 [Echinococcus granulosus]